MNRSAEPVTSAPDLSALMSGLGLRFESRPATALIPYAKNARTHSDEQVALIAGSIRSFGFTNPILIDGGNGIIAGHSRLAAARKLGLATVPVIEVSHLSERDKRALILAGNKLTERAGWDMDLLALEVGDLGDLGIDIASLGFTLGEIDDLMVNGDGDAREEDGPEPPEEPVSRAGDLWVLGRHRVLCGDATDRECVVPLLDRVSPHLMVTDPPYGVSYDPAWRNDAGLSSTGRTG